MRGNAYDGVADDFDFGSVELLSEWAFQLWWHLGVVVTGTVQSRKRQRELAAREVVNDGISFTGGKPRTLRIYFWTYCSRLDCKKDEKNSKQRLSSQERAPKNRWKNAGDSSKGHRKNPIGHKSVALIP